MFCFVCLTTTVVVLFQAWKNNAQSTPIKDVNLSCVSDIWSKECHYTFLVRHHENPSYELRTIVNIKYAQPAFDSPA